MPELTIPLVGPLTQRQTNAVSAFSGGKDQMFRGVIFARAADDQTQSFSLYAEKRPGYVVATDTAATANGIDLFLSPSTAVSVSAWGSPIAVYVNTTACGSLGTLEGMGGISEAIFGGVTYYLIGGTGNGYYIPATAVSLGTTFTGDTHSNTTIDNIAGATGVHVGQLITGNDIPDGTRIESRSPDTTTPTSITITQAATGTTAGVTFTRTHMARILSPNYPTTSVGPIIELDGFLFVAGSGGIYNSDLNSVISWSSGSFIPCNTVTDGMVCIRRYKNKIIGFGAGSIETFFNAGNASNSPLSRITGETYYIGAKSSAVPFGFSFGEYFAFPGSINGSYAGMYEYTGNSIQKISNRFVDSLTTHSNGSGFAFSRVFAMNGNHYVYLSGATELLYSFELKQWFPPNLLTASNFTRAVIVGAGLDVYFSNGSGDDTTGQIYRISGYNPVYQDNGSAYTMTIQTEPKFLNGGKPFIIDWIDVICDTQASGASTVLASGDDYATFDTLGTIDLTSQLKRIQPGGRYESSVAFKLTDAGNQPWRGQALKVHWTPCL